MAATSLQQDQELMHSILSAPEAATAATAGSAQLLR